MLNVPASTPHVKRTIRPLYAQHQATAWSGFLDPTWTRDKDIVPGMVMVRKEREVFAPYNGSNGVPFGLAALFVAPKMGIDEVTPTGTNLFTVWVGGNDSAFEILAPAFDVEADWEVPTDGSVVLLTGNADSQLTPTGATAANAIAELIDVPSTDKIVVRPLRPAAA